MSLYPHSMSRLGIIVVAAGQGERLGAGKPKAFTKLEGRTLIEYAIRTVLALPEPGQLVLVVPESHATEALELTAAVSPEPETWHISVVNGGRERHESVRFGLEALHDSVETVLVHDAARPLTPVEVFERVESQVRHTGNAVIPVIAVADTLKRVTAEGNVVETVDRASLVAVQTPQGFPREILTAAHTAFPQEAASDTPPTDDAELVQRAGGSVHTVAGSPFAHKLTVAADLLILLGLLRTDHDASWGDQ